MDEDRQLMARLQQGDDNALEPLVLRHRAPAEQYARSILRDDALAEDVVQEAFARVYLCRAAYRPEFTFRTWLMVMVRHLCIDQLRRRARAPVPVDTLPEIPTASAESACLARLHRLQLMDELSALREPDRTLLIGYALEGRSYQALAQMTGLSSPQVRVRLHRLRKRLREKERDPE